ncbi:MAG: glycosyltransferase family 2 protein [Cytophagales bacterium]|nr:glycosyltransferase family 2 protein [Rhizobacter sp.]
MVAIGRNEGQRLRACLTSVVRSAQIVVYVDSGSTDDSVAMAQQMGVEVVVLPKDVVFTAALARNAGWRRALELAPSIEFVQFVDGDCAVDPAWLAKARGFLVDHTDVVAVCGRRRERYPERSIYNLLCDLDWAAVPGESKACGGDVMMRAAALQSVGGYNPRLIAGEEPELCLRLRAKGWRVWRLNAEMTLHDAAMTRISQWWKRSMRAGYTFAEGVHMHGAPPERHRVVESRRAWVWGLVIPLAALLGAALISPWLLAVLLVYPLQMLRLYRGFKGPAKERAARAMFMVLGKFAEASGQLKFVALRLSGGTARLIEYK